MKNISEHLRRGSASHKGQNGKVLVIAGSKDFTGAPALSAEAALRAGCDLVKVLTSQEIKDVVSGYSENLIVEGYNGGYFTQEDVGRALEMSEWADSVVIGPGLSRPEKQAVKEFVERTDAPLIVDADAIEPAQDADIGQAVFTPHSGELKSILDEYGTEERFIEETGAVLVVKGETDKVYTKDGLEEIETGTSAMTVGGTGDVLTGIIASLVSQSVELGQAAALGVTINGESGKICTQEFGNGMLATDLIEKIPRVIKD
ncbi:MAG: NAD(P)H-hydrate dehydratase [Candidatus Nanohaloarchaea archaeon]